MSQLGYGVADPVGSPFQVIQPVASQAIQITGNKLILNNTASVASVAVTLPLNPPDGCVVQIMSVAGTTTSTVAAATGDTLTVTGGAAAVTAFTANTVFEYSYSLNGGISATTGAVINARTWFRTR